MGQCVGTKRSRTQALSSRSSVHGKGQPQCRELVVKEPSRGADRALRWGTKHALGEGVGSGGPRDPFGS